MGEGTATTGAGGTAGKTSVTRLLSAIGYPERMSGGAMPFTLRVDGMDIGAEESGGRLLLTYALGADAAQLPTLAGYAAGRMLREEAVLAYGDGRAFLWQDAPADADAHALLRLFETFTDSCDWWRARVDALSGEESGEAPAPETMMIRP